MQDAGDFVSQPRVSNVSEQLELRVCRAWHRTVSRGGGATSAGGGRRRSHVTC
jgi:hypothetical protein